MTEYTKGPWRKTPGYIADSTGSKVVACYHGRKNSVMKWVNHYNETEADANAHLIAAAPELLEALGGCADALNECAKQFRLEKLFGHAQLAENHLRDAHAAIAKATNARR